MEYVYSDRDILFLKAINSSIKNTISAQKNTRITKIVGSKITEPKGILSRFVNRCTLKANVGLIAKLTDDNKLEAHPLLSEDISVINSELDVKIHVTKIHEGIDIKYITVKKGQRINKNEPLAYNRKPRYIKLSKLEGIITNIKPSMNPTTLDIIVEREYYLSKDDGIKLIGIDAMKSTTRTFINRFRITENRELLNRAKTLFEDKGYRVKINDHIKIPDIIMDLTSVFKRGAWNFLADISVLYKNPNATFEEVIEEWNKNPTIYLEIVKDTKTNEDYICVIGLLYILIGEQVPDFETKFSRLTDRGIRGPKLDIFSRYLVRSKFGEEIEELLSIELREIEFDDSEPDEVVTDDEIWG